MKDTIKKSNTNDMSQIRILIVDDNPRNVEVAAISLSEIGYSFEHAFSGEEALAWIREESFDLILLDIMMPELNGYEVCNLLKKVPEYADVPVIFLTAKTDEESLSKAFEAGGVDYISKPFRNNELLARVKTHLDLKQSKQALKELNANLEKKVAKRTRHLKKTMEELQLAKNELEALDQVKTEFLYMVSHEIRTPLNGIMGGTELLKMSDLSPELFEYLDILDESAQRLEKFSLQALDITQLNIEGKKLMNLELISLPDFLNDFIRNLVQLKKFSVGRLVLNVPKKDFIVEADTKYLKRVLSIVTDNAINITPENKTILLKLKQEKNKIHCVVRDHGPGFPKSMLRESIMTYSSGIEHHDRRTGLNLHLARLIMQVFNGNLQLSNITNGGAMVEMIFPVA